MATTTAPARPEARPGEGYVRLPGVTWAQYETLDAWADDWPGVRLVYLDGDLEIITGKSRRHEWYSRCVFELVAALARAAGVACEAAGETTYKAAARAAGSQADETFYLGPHAEAMAGPRDPRPGVDPVPDLAVEVEVSRPVAGAVAAWARLGVPEVWHVDARSPEPAVTVLRRGGDGGYTPADASGFLPVSAAEVQDELRAVTHQGSTAWRDGLDARARQLAARRGPRP